MPEDPGLLSVHTRCAPSAVIVDGRPAHPCGPVGTRFRTRPVAASLTITVWSGSLSQRTVTEPRRAIPASAGAVPTTAPEWASRTVSAPSGARTSSRAGSLVGQTVVPASGSRPAVVVVKVVRSTSVTTVPVPSGP